MSVMATVIVVATVAVALVLVVVFFTGKNPSQGEGGPPPAPGESARDQTADRPAGPDAEDMSPEHAPGDGSPPAP